MPGKKIMAAMVVLIFSVAAPEALGKRFHFTSTNFGRPKAPSFSSLCLESKVLAQNDPSAGARDEKLKSDSSMRGSKPESESTADDKNKSSNAKAKALKPFVPSEKIPGGQAVDFPVDI